MCTVTIVPERRLSTCLAANGRAFLRVACNRDELLTRSRALPPTTWIAGARSAVMPIDPGSGGTWIAANDAGLVFVVLNVNAGERTEGRVSRGTIIPALISCASTAEALDRLLSIPAGNQRPFRLLLIDRYQLAECWPEHSHMRHRRALLQGPVLRTSSGLGDAVVVGPRRTLFRQMFRDAGDACRAQDEYHQHQWIGRESVSVRMERADARTVSHTVVEVGNGFVRLAYRSVDSAESISVHLARVSTKHGEELSQFASGASS